MSRPVPHRPVAEALEDRFLPSANPWLVAVFHRLAVFGPAVVSAAVTAMADAQPGHTGDGGDGGTTTHDTDKKADAKTAADSGTATDSGQDTTSSDSGQRATDTGGNSSNGGTSVQSLGVAATATDAVTVQSVGVISLGGGGTTGGDSGGTGGQAGKSPADPATTPAASPHKGQEGLPLVDPTAHGPAPAGVAAPENPAPEAQRPETAAAPAAAESALAAVRNGAALAREDPFGAADEAAAPEAVKPAASEGPEDSGAVGTAVTTALKSVATYGAERLLDLLPGTVAVAGAGVQDLLDRLDGLGEHLAGDGGGAIYAWLVAGTAAAAVAEVGRRHYVRPTRPAGALAYFPELR